MSKADLTQTPAPGRHHRRHHLRWFEMTIYDSVCMIRSYVTCIQRLLFGTAVRIRHQESTDNRQHVTIRDWAAAGDETIGEPAQGEHLIRPRIASARD
jgi:hypothetical protein